MRKIYPKRFVQWSFIFFILTLLPGCWNYREVDKLALISGVGIDKDTKTGNYIVTVEAIKIKAGNNETKFVPDIMSYEGATMFDAVRKMVMIAGKKLYWSHVKIMIISQEVAKEGVLPVLDLFSRDYEIRKDMLIALSGEPTARVILTGNPRLNDLVSLHLNSMLTNNKHVSTYPQIELYQFTNLLNNAGISGILPVVRLLRQDNKLTPQFYGTAIFKKDRLIGFLNGEETKLLLLIRNQLKGGLLIKDVTIANPPFKMTLEIFKMSAKLKPAFPSNNKSLIRIEVQADLSAAELMGTDDPLAPERLKSLTRSIEKWLADRIVSFVRKTQQDYPTDIFGFGNAIELANPKYFKDQRRNWHEVFSTLSVQSKVKATIRHSAGRSKPLQTE